MIDKLFKQIRPLLSIVKRYAVIIAVVVVAGVYGYVIFTSSQLSQVEPGDAAISEAYKGAKKPKIEDAIADKIHELEDRNTQFQTLIDEARQNPFQE